MTDSDLDLCYTALCQALGEAGEDKAQLFLGMVALGLVARAPGPQEVLALIDAAAKRCREGGGEGG